MTEIEGECGCAITYEFCEHHRKLAEDGMERPHITIEFHGKHSPSAANRHLVNLERVQRIEMGLDDEPMVFDESSLADVLQGIADADPTANATFVLVALANALRGEDPYHKLSLHQTKRGKWQSPSDDTARHRQHCAWIIRLHRLQNQGWQTDAAVHRIAETTGNSVSRVYSGIAEERQWQKILQEFPRFHAEANKLKAASKVVSPNKKD